MRHFILLISLLLAKHSFAQVIPIKIKPYSGNVVHLNAEDTFNVEKIAPNELTQLITQNKKCLVYIYKPYCSGLKKNFSKSGRFLSAAIDKGYYVIFLATTTEGLEGIPELIARTGHLEQLNYYVINVQISRAAFEKALAPKKIKTVLIYQNNILMHMLDSWKLDELAIKKL
jgi:hypothetical protein